MGGAPGGDVELSCVAAKPRGEARYEGSERELAAAEAGTAKMLAPDHGAEETEEPPVPWGKVRAMRTSASLLTRRSGRLPAAHEKRKPVRAAADCFCCSQVYMVTMAVASDAIALSGPVPFLPKMCVDTFGLPPDQVGIMVGIITGSYSLANFASSVMIGHASDLYGRKPFLLLGLFFSALCTLALGLVHNVWLAVATRALVGTFNCNFALSRAAISDLIPAGRRSQAYGVMGATFALARTLSSAIGGLTVGLFLAPQLGPYFAPCVILTAPPALTFLLVLLFLPEPNARRRYASARDILSSAPRLLNPPAPGEAPVARAPRSFREKWALLSSDSLMVRLIAAYGFVSFGNGSVFAAVVLFLTSSLQRHGLGMSEAETGLAFTLLGVAGFVCQVLLYDRAVRSLGLRAVLRAGLATMLLSSVLMPCAEPLLALAPPALRDAQPWVKWGILAPVVSLQGAGIMFCLPVLTTVLSNAARADIQGLTQGTAQSISSLLRGLGPLTMGAAFTLTYHLHAPAISFALLGAAYAATLALVWRLPDCVEERKAPPQNGSNAAGGEPRGGLAAGRALLAAGAGRARTLWRSTSFSDLAAGRASPPPARAGRAVAVRLERGAEERGGAGLVAGDALAAEWESLEGLRAQGAPACGLEGGREGQAEGLGFRGGGGKRASGAAPAESFLRGGGGSPPRPATPLGAGAGGESPRAQPPPRGEPPC